jgi:outer membrane lipoprotein-sorting protein
LLLSATSPARAAASLDSFASAWGSVNNYAVTMSMYETKGTESQRRTYSYEYKKPNYARIQILSGPGQGNIAVWDGGDTVSGSKVGMFAGFKKSFSITDPAVTTLRGDTIDQASFAWILQHIQTTKGDLATAAGPTIENQQTTQLSLRVADPASNGGITYEVVFLSNTTNLPVRVWRYAGADVVKQITFTNLKINQ